MYDLAVEYMHCERVRLACKTDRQTDRYFIDGKEVITDLFVIEMKEIYVHVDTRLLIC